MDDEVVEKAPQERTVAIEVAIEEEPGSPELDERLNRLREAVADGGGVPLRTSDPRRYGARFNVAGDPDQAVEAGVQAFEEAAGHAGVPASPVVEVEAVTLDEVVHEAQDGDLPELVGITEVADLLGVTVQLATVIARFDWFPAPAAELDAGPVWKRSALERFLDLTRTDAETAGKLAEAADRAKPPASRAVSPAKEGPEAEAAGASDPAAAEAAAEADRGDLAGERGEPGEVGEPGEGPAPPPPG